MHSDPLDPVLAPRRAESGALEDNSRAIGTLLRPKSIVIVGASEKSRWSVTAFENLTQEGFRGELHLVNPRGGLVHGRLAATSCAALNAKPDVAIVLVPGHAIVEAIHELGAAGVGAAVVLTSGFAETGAAGEKLQEQLAEAARAHDVRLLGPNSLGFINYVDRTVAWTTRVMAPSSNSGVAIVSQSGATAFFLANLAYQQDIGLSYVVATGNEVDLDFASFVDYLIEDPDTRAVAIFIETVRHPERFIDVARKAASAGKPLVVLKVGASEVTARSALAHTGALVGDDRIFEGLCRQYGVIRVRSIEDLVATADIVAKIVAKAGLLQPGGLCVVSNSGGICEIAADTADARGISMPDIPETAIDEIRSALPGYGTPHNPLDLTGGIVPEACERLIGTLGAQSEYAVILCPFYPVPTVEREVNLRLMELYEHLGRGLATAPVPGFLVSYTNASVTELGRKIIAETQLPYLACGLDRAITGLAGALWWSEHQRRWAAKSERCARSPAHSTHDCSREGMQERPRSEREALEFLARQHVPVVPATRAVTEDEAARAAASFDCAVVLKIASPDIAHKSDIGGVALNLHGEEAVRAAFRRVTSAARSQMPHARIDGVLVSPMRERGIELFVGCSRDREWGPVLTVGLGGLWVEVLQDVALRLLPVDAGEIRIMLNELRGAKLLRGQRGVPTADLDAVTSVIARIGEAALRLGAELEALDVNPLWVRGDSVEALDALFVWHEQPLSV